MGGASRKRKRGDYTGSRVNKHSSKRIVTLFGEREPVVEYPSKRSGDICIPQPLQHSVVAHNDTWSDAVLGDTATSRRQE
ncbi:hypothetical protein SCP_0705720 [Sparassis crispa]|uniref:Uncharacterized protein n=1 Tax=Sparassis crispa TaxID=139825 RepID=A0A401GT82_9APHY|nr:hypothetical protein SCP_0705660 [Sparassis crispa]XP_027616298.1 hypothetical protein SCP_0705720 [Sparassis crispa]GBE85379.1 hypothetical protein SCP_0705660 [Sparassis crispa]GBE85385.1 hypothetical protein SCP_0705720 [Sparassis crispa]